MALLLLLLSLLLMLLFCRMMPCYFLCILLNILQNEKTMIVLDWRTLFKTELIGSNMYVKQVT